MNAKIAAGLRKRQFSNRFEDDFREPNRETILMGGRQAGKSTIMRELVEKQESLAAAIIRSSGMTSASLTASTGTHPWSSKSAEEILADMKRVSDEIAKKGAQFTPGIVNITTQEQIMNNPKEEAAKQLAAQINQKLTQTIRPGPFKLTGPAQLTIKTRQSQYKKKAFLGDETMSLTSVYGGKREVIAVFKNALPVDYSYIEIPLSDATTQLAGFKEYLASLGVADIDTIVAGIEQQKTQTAAAEHTELLADPEFASW